MKLSFDQKNTLNFSKLANSIVIDFYKIKVLKFKAFQIFLLVLLLFYGFPAMGQKYFVKNQIENLNNLQWKRFSYGLQLGTNYFEFYRFNVRGFERKEVAQTEEKEIAETSNSTGVGFNVGVMAKYRLSEFIQFSFEPSLHFGREQELVSIEYGKEQDSDSDTLFFIPSAISFPFLIELGIYRLNNLRPFFLTGLSLNKDISKTYEHKNELINPLHFKRKEVILNYEIGLGIDFLLYRFRVTPSVRWSVSSHNIIKQNIDANAYVESGKNSVFLVNIGISPF